MIVVIMGVAGSGKTLIGGMLAAELHWPFFDADAFHSPEAIAKMASGVPLAESDRVAGMGDLAEGADVPSTLAAPPPLDKRRVALHPIALDARRAPVHDRMARHAPSRRPTSNVPPAMPSTPRPSGALLAVVGGEGTRADVGVDRAAAGVGHRLRGLVVDQARGVEVGG